jgi:hypothetical protein
MSAHDDESESPAACAACPFGAVMATMQAASPEATDHLLNAAHELLQAARVVIDAADSVIEQQREARARRGEPRVRRIDIS